MIIVCRICETHERKVHMTVNCWLNDSLNFFVTHNEIGNGVCANMGLLHSGYKPRLLQLLLSEKVLMDAFKTGEITRKHFRLKLV